MNKDTQFTLIAKTLYGLEDVLASELIALGAEDVTPGRRMVSFRGDKKMLYAANVRLRTALRILKPIISFRAKTADEIYEALRSFDWAEFMSVDQTFSIDSVVYSDSFKNSQYVGYRTKDALVDFFRENEGKRPSVRLSNPDILLNIHISHDEVTLSLDSSGQSLHKRGYRVAETTAPLNEVLAAGILLKTGWNGGCDLIDPMCGSGTFLIEAALIACNIAPGIYRRGFAFERWPDFDSALFEEIYHDDSAERPFHHTIYGSDILPQAIAAARKNIERAGLGRYITLDVLPMQQRPKPEGKVMLVMNPPYGERIKVEDMQELYAMIGERLKHNYSGSTAWILAFKSEHFNHIGLRLSHREKLMNGSLECELRGYELFEGRREEYAQQRNKQEYSNPRSSQVDDQPKRNSHRERLRRNFKGQQESNSIRKRSFGPKSEHCEEKDRGASQRFDRGRFPRKNDRKRPDRVDKNEKKVFRSPNSDETGRRERRRVERPFRTSWPSDRFRSNEGTEGSSRKSSSPIQVIRNDDPENK